MDGQTNPEEYRPNPCERCGEEVDNHAQYTNVEAETVMVCRGEAQEQLDDAVVGVVRVWRETMKRLGLNVLALQPPAHLAEDIAVTLWNVYGEEDDTFSEMSDEDAEYRANGGHYRGCDGDNCHC